jgi:hypothetical protein
VRFCERLERDAKKANILSGLYILGLEPIANLKVREPEIRRCIFDYMERTKAVNISPCETLAATVLTESTFRSGQQQKLPGTGHISW